MHLAVVKILLTFPQSHRGNFITGLGDYKVFHNEHFLAKQLAESGPKASCAALEDVDVYVQPFSMTGKVLLNDIDEEVYVWGYRRKQMLAKEEARVEMRSRITVYTEVRNVG